MLIELETPIELADGRKVLSCEDTFYRVQMASGEVQAFPAKAEATPENAIDDLIYHPPAPPAPSVAEVWAQKLAGRLVDPVTEIPLPATIEARNILTATLVFLRAGLDAGAITLETEQTIWDADNTPRALPVSDLIPLLLRYGALWKAMHAEFAP